MQTFKQPVFSWHWDDVDALSRLSAAVQCLRLLVQTMTALAGSERVSHLYLLYRRDCIVLICRTQIRCIVPCRSTHLELLV